MNSIKLLDCTLRDGGNALEDDNYYRNSLHSFEPYKGRIIEELASSGIDILEIGIIDPKGTEKRNFSYYDSVEAASSAIQYRDNEEQLFVVGSNIEFDFLEKIPCWRPGLCDGIRVYMVYSKLKESLIYSSKLAEKGYKVFLQNSLTMRYTLQDIEYMCDTANKMGAYAVYFVDTNGYMTCDDVIEIAKVLDGELDDKIRIGFHAHDHLGGAFCNSATFAELKLSHNKIIDACVLGMGRGGGNLKTEQWLPYINSKYDTSYTMNNVLNVCEILDEFIAPQIWGYSTINFLSALHKTTNKYTIALKCDYYYKYSEINDILGCLSDDIRHRYTKENMRKLLERYHLNN